MPAAASPAAWALDASAPASNARTAAVANACALCWSKFRSICDSENHAQYVCRLDETGTGGRLIATVAYWTAVATSLPLESASNAPWAAAGQALAGAPPRLAHANHSA